MNAMTIKNANFPIIDVHVNEVGLESNAIDVSFL